jgi:nitrogen fixation protein FixH
LLLLPLDFPLSFLYVAAMFKTTVIILSLVWASLLLISWGGAENPPTQVSSIAFEQRGF